MMTDREYLVEARQAGKEKRLKEWIARGMSKCYFCGEPTEGRKFVVKNFFTNEKEEFDVCENCYDQDLEDEDQRANGGKINES